MPAASAVPAASAAPAAWSAVGARRPLPGRERDLDRLCGMLRDAAAGRTGWAVVSGEPGAGKTRVAEELARRAADTGYEVRWTRCAGEGHPGAGPPAGGLRPLTGTAERTAEDAVPPAPTLCIVEDVHLASAGTRTLLSFAARTLRDAPLLVLCTVADEPGPATERLLAELAGRDAERIRLAPLTEAAVRHVVLATADDGHVTDDRAREFLGLSGGNPFLLTQLLKQAADPRVSRAGGRVPVPPAVQSVVRVRLAELSPAARRVVDTAAVLGGRPDMGLVARLTGLPAGQVLELADQAVAARLLSWSEELPPHETGGYRFPAGVLLRGVLADLGPARRQALHAEADRLLAARTVRNDTEGPAVTPVAATAAGPVRAVPTGPVLPRAAATPARTRRPLSCSAGRRAVRGR
ncbi:AAA family ATPase [Streptomyces sp. NPDC088812]|uniref:AAA family ATPase n=1 Tax=Streptomyces sp. NPDC088812 TaxID=3365905 RepID=UPI00380FAE65